MYVCTLISQDLCCLPDGNFELLLRIKQESGQFFIWLVEADEQNLLHIRNLVTHRIRFVIGLLSLKAILCITRHRERNDQTSSNWDDKLFTILTTSECEVEYD